VFALHVATHTCAGVGIGIAIQGGPAVTAACKSNIGYEVWCAIGTVLLGCRLLYQVSILRCGMCRVGRVDRVRSIALFDTSSPSGWQVRAGPGTACTCDR
jgi:hypothetical protein